MAATVTPRQALYAHLMADPNVVALVAGRIYHITPPQNASCPLLVLNTASNVDRRDLGGVAYTETRLRVTAMAATLTEAEAVAMAVRRSVEGFSGLMADELPVIDCRVAAYLPDYQPELRQVHYHVDIIVTHKGGM